MSRTRTSTTGTSRTSSGNDRPSRLPFYTWSARNIPFQAKNVVAKPGKYANYQKVREEATKGSGVDQQDQQTRDLYAQLERRGEAPAGLGEDPVGVGAAQRRHPVSMEGPQVHGELRPAVAGPQRVPRARRSGTS
jgi:hypothetical protein